jgi:HTH-type transcriptional regulator/antitoxin HigA
MVHKKPFMNIGPGEFLKEEIKARNWTNDILAEILGVAPKTVSALLNNKQRITIETANLLSNAFGQSAQYWLNLDNNYRLRLQENSEKAKVVETKTLIYERMPIPEMVKRGWIKSVKKLDDLTKQVMAFWKIKEMDLSFMDNAPKLHYRKSEAFSKFNQYYAITWSQMARIASYKISLPVYNSKKLETLAAKIPEYSCRENGVKKFIEALNKCGVKFIVLFHFPKTYTDGASFMDGKNPVIIYTKRYDRVDNFWFTMAHEIAHVLLHVKGDEFYMDNLDNNEPGIKEKEADDFAREVLKTKKIIEFFTDYKHYTSEIRINAYAEENKISPAIITGILKYHGILMYNRLNHLQEKVSGKIPLKYFVDK